MASRGLRTLVFGIRELSGIIDVDSLTPQDVEQNITLLGATAVEDLLQDDVEKCIQDFRTAGIKVWMLTGDSGLTAKEIAQTCGLLKFNYSQNSAS